FTPPCPTTKLCTGAFWRVVSRPKPYWWGGGEGAAEAPSRFQRWVVARVHGLRQEPLLVVRPELAHLRIRLDRGVDELAALLLAAAAVEVPDDAAKESEPQRTARSVD